MTTLTASFIIPVPSEGIGNSDDKGCENDTLEVQPRLGIIFANTLEPFWYLAKHLHSQLDRIEESIHNPTSHIM